MFGARIIKNKYPWSPIPKEEAKYVITYRFVFEDGHETVLYSPLGIKPLFGALLADIAIIKRYIRSKKES